MSTYLFTVPLASGKTEAWKGYMKELSGPRNEEYKKSRQRAGVDLEQVFLQQTPHGDMCVVRIESDDPQRFFEMLATSSDPFDKWFRDKVLVDAHDMDMSKPFPTNEHFVTCRVTPVKEAVGSAK